MSLADHLRELRYRLIVSVLVIGVGAILAGVWYEPLYEVLMHPYQAAVDMLARSNPQIDTTTVISGVTAPFTLALTVCIVAGLVAPYKKVRQVEFIDAIPKSSAGKILRRELRGG